MQEDSLEKRVIADESAAFEELVTFYREKVRNTCYCFLNNRKDAEDLAQEVFVKVCRSITNFRGESKLSTSIYRIALTKSLDHIRKKKQKKDCQSAEYIWPDERRPGITFTSSSPCT